MHAFFVEFQERFDFCHAEIHAVLDRLPDEALDWQPAAHMNSIAVLIAHLTGAEQYWIAHMAAQQPTERVRDEEFKVANLTVAEVKAVLHSSQAYVHSVLPKISMDDLEQPRAREGDERSFTVAWCLLHALEHSATHVGHVQMMGDMWEVGNSS